MPTEELLFGGKRIVLVGTAHVSDESVKAVEEAIAKYAPDVVAVELCQQRFNALKDEKRWEETDILEVISSDRVHLFLLQIMLANFQRKIGEDVGVKPGAEMLKAIEIAGRSGAKILLADRDIKVTLKRTIDQMTLKEKAKVVLGFVEGFVEGENIDKELIERLKEKDVLTELIEELAVETPSIKRVLVDERDEYIARRLHTCESDNVVAVVGAGHMAGIIRNLRDMEGKVLVTHSLSIDGVKIQKGGFTMAKKIGILSWITILAFVAIFAWGLSQKGTTMALDMLVKWFLVTGTIAAMGPLVAFGHPLTILAAFVSAPLKILHPTIATGWIAGWVEFKMRKPRVIDFKSLVNLKTLSDYLNNRVFKIILVVAFTNLTAMAGNIIGLAYMATLI